MSINSASNKNNTWTTQKFISLSENLGQAYSGELNKTETSQKSDFWTTDKFISMSRHLSSAYGIDF